MPRGGSGTYTLPIAAYVSGTTIVSADMNTNLSDIGTALTQSLATTGVSSMTGPIKAFDGTVSAPGITLASDTTSGFYRQAASTFGYTAAGTLIVTLGPSGLAMQSSKNIVDSAGGFVTGRFIGEVFDFAGTVAPARCLFCFGQAISRTTYALLFAVIGTTYGVGDGVTTFNIPDCRGRARYGKGDMGGADASRITVAGGNFDGTVLGGVGGAQNHVQTTSELVTHSHGVTDAGHTHTQNADTPVSRASGADAFTGTSGTEQTGSSVTGITINNAGSSSAASILGPAIIFNVCIYTGA